MQRLQNRALRIIYRHVTGASLSDLHILANLGKLAQRTNRQTLCLMYRRAHLSDHFCTEIVEGTTRSSSKIKFHLPKPTCKHFTKFPLYYGAGLWDRVHVATQKSNEYCIFKMKIPQKPNLDRFPASWEWTMWNMLVGQLRCDWN